MPLQRRALSETGLVVRPQKIKTAPEKGLRYFGEGVFSYGAFTVLQCGKCSHEVSLEAHHDHQGRPIKAHEMANVPDWDKICPVCGYPHWCYVRTELHVSPTFVRAYKLSPRQLAECCDWRVFKRVRGGLWKRIAVGVKSLAVSRFDRAMKRLGEGTDLRLFNPAGKLIAWSPRPGDLGRSHDGYKYL